MHDIERTLDLRSAQDDRLTSTIYEPVALDMQDAPVPTSNRRASRGCTCCGRVVAQMQNTKGKECDDNDYCN